MLVDIHNHILPGLDDGPIDEEFALWLARNAAENGITHIIATPHHQNGKYMNKKTVVQECVEYFNQQLIIHDIPITILPGMEIHMFDNILEEIDGNLLTLADSKKYLLVELPNSHIPHFTKDILYELQLKGYIPIIAHAERNTEFRSNPDKIFEIIKNGGLMQVTASSILGVNGKKLQKHSLKMCKNKLVHFIASDAHHHKNRPFLLSNAYKYLTKNVSSDLVSYFQENSKHVVLGTEFHPMPPIKIKTTLFER